MKTTLCAAALVAMTAGLVSANEVEDDKMLALTQVVLMGLNPDAQVVAPTEKADLSSLVTQAIKEGQSDDYLQALIGEAVDNGTLEVPDAMVSTDGEVDTKTMLASLVRQSLQETATDRALVSEAAGAVEAPAEVEMAESDEPRRHTVSSGESLAGIALQYYGDAAQYEMIFAANRSSIDRPNLIRVGQVILIP